MCHIITDPPAQTDDHEFYVQNRQTHSDRGEGKDAEACLSQHRHCMTRYDSHSQKHDNKIHTETHLHRQLRAQAKMIQVLYPNPTTATPSHLPL